MDWPTVQKMLTLVQHGISILGVFVILAGVLFAIYQYIYYLFVGPLVKKGSSINEIRLKLGRALILGLEFIVAADLIGSTNTPDYYALGILAIIVLIRTLLSYSLNRELQALNKE